MSSREIAEWMAFSQLEPFGSEANYVGHAIVAATMANIHRKKGKKAYEISDFMPKKKKVQTAEEALQIAHMMTIGMGGKDLREKDE